MLTEIAGALLLGVVQQNVAGVNQVVCHKARCQFGVALFDSHHDRPVKLERMLKIDPL